MLSNGVTNIDSVTNFREYVKRAAECGMSALCFTEHGCTLEWVHKKEEIEKAGMKYIHGVEAYLTESMFEKVRDNYHCVLIAKNYDGVKELNKLVSKSFCRVDNHFYYTPRISFDELFNTSDNIIVTTACLGGVLNNGTSSAIDKMISFLYANKNRCFLELQHHNVEDQIKYNQYLVELSSEIGVPLIVGTDTHEIDEKHMECRDIMQKSKGVKFQNENDFDLSFKTPDELIAAYKKQNAISLDIVKNAMQNTIYLTDMVEEFDLDRSNKYPVIYDDPERVFKRIINEEYKNKKISAYENSQEYLDRIQYEYDSYACTGAIPLMLLEYDLKKNMREQGVRYGPGRGSVCGSVIAWLLGITAIDSIKYGLNFDRFINRERISLADIDTDWSPDDKEKVKEYLYNRDGLYCCEIVTYNTIQLRGAIRDVARALEIPLEDVAAICDLAESDIEAARKKYPKLMKYAEMCNGVIVSVGNHPAATVVSPYPVDEWFGLISTTNNPHPVSAINMKEVESLNFLKLDVLSLDNIGLISKTCDLVGISYLTPDNTPENDIDVWNSIRDDTSMIFQFESGMASNLLKKFLSDNTINSIKNINPNIKRIDIMSMCNAALRPVGDSFRDDMANGICRDNGNAQLNDFLSDTLEYVIYQCQIIEFLHKYCGFSMGRADIVRRAFSKKTGTEQYIPEIKIGFIKTMNEEYGVSQSESEKIIENFLQVILDASNYLFSKNHAYPYSWVGYICGYLRYHYPIEFLTTALNVFDTEKKMLAAIQYAKKIGIELAPIKFRYSGSDYKFNKKTNKIYKGIASIKYMNSTIAEELYNLRKNEYDSFIDLLFAIESKTSVNSRQLKILIKLNFFEEFGNANLLLKMCSTFDSLHGKKQVKKDFVTKNDIPQEIVKQFSQKETPKMFTGIDSRGLINWICENKLEASNQTVKDLVESQIEYLGYIDIADEKYAGFTVVVSVDKKYSPKLNMHSLKNGNNIDVKINKKVFSKEPINKGDIVRIKKQKTKPRVRRDDNGNFVPVPGTREIWITDYQIVEDINY